MLDLQDVTVIFNEGTTLEKKALNELSVHINPGEFVTILGSNGAGKSTFVNVITGSAKVKAGTITLDGQDITDLPEHVRSRTIGRLFQDPSQGTAPHLTVEENLGLSVGTITLDGQDITDLPEHVRSRTIGRLFQDPSQGTAPHLTVEENLGLSVSSGRSPFAIAVRKKEEEQFKTLLSQLNMGLEDRLKTPIGLLSGGQRQAVALMMAVANPPKLLLLDEHTAALDPVSAKKILAITNDLIRKNHMTALMITHNLKDALENGDRLLIFQDGKITHDFSGEAKAKLTLEDLVHCYDI